MGPESFRDEQAHHPARGLGELLHIKPMLLAKSIIHPRIILTAALLCMAPLQAAVWIKGADVSSLAKSEALGGTYKDANGNTGDALAILKSNGVNTIRLRVFHTPADGYNNQAKVVAMAVRAKALGMKVLVDFHYSDVWADPGTQTKPAAWSGHTLAQLKTDVYNHTYEVCSAMVTAGAAPDYVQIGNEINDGMLWSEGRVSTNGWNFGNLSQLLAQGIAAVRAAAPQAGVVLHIAKATDWAAVQWWFDSVKAQGIDWDYTGVSYYPYWHGTLTDMQTAINGLAARFARPVLICETAYPFTLGWADNQNNVIGMESQLTSGYPATVAGQRAMMKAILDIVNAVPNQRGAGVIYWDATWTPVTGNGWDNTNSNSGNNWENQALFDFTGKALASQTIFADYAGYQSAYFSGRDLANSSISGDQADPDGDGLKNLLEYAFATNPLQSSDSAFTTPGFAAVSGEDYLKITFHRLNPSTGLLYTVETAPSPAGPWSSTNAAVQVGSPTTISAGVESVVFRSTQAISAGGATRQFMRVKVQRF